MPRAPSQRASASRSCRPLVSVLSPAGADACLRPFAAARAGSAATAVRASSCLGAKEASNLREAPALAGADQSGNRALALRHGVEKNDREPARLVAAIDPGVIRPALDHDIAGAQRHGFSVVQNHTDLTGDADHIID